MRDINNQDDITINVEEKWEMEWWPWLLGVSRKELLSAIKSVGPKLNRVKQWLNMTGGNLA
jgi:hypothetical protein